MVDGEEEAELQGATASALLLGLGSCGGGIGLDAMRGREETGGAMAAALNWLWPLPLGFIPELWLQGAQARSGRYNDGRIRRTRRPCGL